MNKLYDIVRLVMTSTLSDSDIAASLHVARNTVCRYRRLAEAHGYEWAQLSTMEPSAFDSAFNRRRRGLIKKRQPDFVAIHHELQTHGVTLLLLWEEYCKASPEDALSYSQFTFHYRQFSRRVALSMRQDHPPGARGFVDFSGKRPRYVVRETGEVQPVELFVAALGYSHLIFATAVATQTLPDWIDAHVAMFAYFGGAPAALVPDNLRSAVTKPGRDALLNRTYEDMARHYGTVILPARPRHPKDKGKVEVGVQVAQRWILARLRHRTFFSLVELNRAITAHLEELNHRPFKRLPGSRYQRFEEAERQALLPLPPDPYTFAEWFTHQVVHADYHVEICRHWYSVPHQLVGEAVEARATSKTVELFHAHQRVACHARSAAVGGHTTERAHMPESHRAQANQTPEYYLAWAEQLGPNVLAVVRQQFDRQWPMLGLPACDVLRRLARQYGPERLEAAAKRAVEIHSLTVKSVRSLLTVGHRLDANDTPMQSDPPQHDNVRGPHYYGKEGGASC